MHQIETELKWALDADGHGRLAQCLEQMCGSPRRLAQNNRFYDTADLRLRSQAMNLRLRHENGRVLMTAKRKRAGSGEGGLHAHDEWEEWLDPALASLPASELASALPLPETHRLALAGAALVDGGGFANTRLEWLVGSDVLCLDATEFSTRIDYELEIETPHPVTAAPRWAAQLATWNISYQAEARTKFARFLALRG